MPLDLDSPNTEMNPDMQVPSDVQPGNATSHDAANDREGAMAKADLYKVASYAHKLFKQLDDNDQLDAWVQAKITKAADYIASVYHYLEYEMKFSEYGKHLSDAETLSEDQKMKVQELLSEAKNKMKELKKAQAEKAKDGKIEEGALRGGERPCAECGGSGMVYEEPKTVPDHVKGKVAKYNTMMKATKAAHARMDANNNGIPDDEEVEEGFDEKSKQGDSFKTKTGVATKTDKGVKHTNTSYKDDGEAEEKSGKGVKSHAKAQSAAEKKEKAPAQKFSPKKDKTWGMKDSEKFDNRDKVDEAKAKCCCEDKGKMKCPVHKPMNEAERTMSRAAKGHEKYGKAGMQALAKAGKEGKSLEPVRAKYNKYDEATAPTKDLPKKGEKVGKEGNAFGKAVRDAKAAGDKTMSVDGKTMPVKEASKPSSGLSAAKKSAVVKDAKAGKDIGKPGKSFDALAKKAGGGEKGTKIAAAAMWKNMKEATAYMAEKKAATKDLPGKQEKLDVAEPKGKLDSKDFAALRAKKETVKESVESPEMIRMREQLSRLNRNEQPILVENREVDQIRALTKRLLG